MELFKTNGQLKPRKALWPHYVEYRTEIAKKQFEDAKKLEHEGLYPEMMDNPAYVVDGEEPKFIANPNFIPYDEWMAEDVVTQAASEAVYDADGFLVTPAVEEVRELVRPFVAPEVLEVELDEYLESRYSTIRKSEYPPIEEFMDAWVKDDTVALQVYKDKCLAVKAKYGKPTI